MHVPDGFLTPALSAATGVVALSGVSVALRRAGRELEDRTAPLVGLVAVFVFATQMVNFPVGAGTSGHLLGGTLAAVLVGPWTATLCLTVVLLVQSLLFADGGVTALGTNVLLMGLVGVWLGYAVARAVLALLPRRRGSVGAAAAVGAFVSVPAAAAVFSVLFALGGQAPVPPATVLAAMVGVHLLIGLGEAAITALLVASVLATRPDLVRLARMGPAASSADLPARSPRAFVLAGLGLAALVAGALSPFASALPDGLEYVSARLGFAHQASAATTPFEGYAVPGVADGRASTGLAGVLGVVVVLAAAVAVATAARAAQARSERQAGAVGHGRGHGHTLYFHAHSPVHTVPAHAKIVGLLVLLLAVITMPSGAWAAYGLVAVLVMTAMVSSAVPLGYLARRMAVETPFAVFALALPFVATGPRTELLGVAVSATGLVAGGTLLAKITLGTAGSLVLATTTSARDLVHGLRHLRAPEGLVAIVAFMVRYVDVVGDQVRRMSMAQASRGFSPRSVRSWPVLAQASGALFVRSYERGERVHLAMLSRGYVDRPPELDAARTAGPAWGVALVLPVLALAVTILARTGVLP
ncbi:MAG: cobalt ECF transporter T component CbiQ [Dermatophilaceae bacterium]